MSVRRKTLKKWVRVSMLAVIIGILVIGLLMVFTSADWKAKEKQKIIYTYNVNQNIDYRVNLYDNSFIEDKFLGKNETYISDLIKSIESKFYYNYSGSKSLNLKYNYNVVATLYGEYKVDDSNSNSKVWSKKYTLIDEKNGEVKDVPQFSIVEDVPIDFHKYDDAVSDFRKELKLPISANLLVKFSITVYGKDGDINVHDTSDMTISIPLNQQAFKIVSDYTPTKDQNVLNSITINVINYRKMISGIVVIICDFIILMCLYRLIFNISKKTYYSVQLNKILKEYGDIVVEIMDPIARDNLNLVSVKNFNEMVDLEEELRIPIMFYELEEYELGEFILVHNNILYQYILNNEKK